jgi:acylglycerol lipase
MTKHKTFSFTGLDGFNIFCQSWHPSDTPLAILLVVHGYAEHSGRYKHMAEHFVALGYAVYALDHRGHGQSDGVRADVVRFEDYVGDLKKFLDIVREREPGRQIFLIAHSLGGAMATLLAADDIAEFDGLITSSVGILVMSNLLRILVKIIQLVAPLVPPHLPLVPLPAEALSRDPEVVTGYQNDPLNYTGKIRARMGVQMLRASDLVEAQVHKITVPMLNLHGTADRLAQPAASQMLNDQAGSADKTLHFYEGLYHEILNEPEKEQVFADVADWLEAHLGL